MCGQGQSYGLWWSVGVMIPVDALESPLNVKATGTGRGVTPAEPEGGGGGGRGIKAQSVRRLVPPGVRWFRFAGGNCPHCLSTR